MNVLAALRTETAAAHAVLEDVLALDRPCLSRARYAAALQMLLAAREGWEPELEALFPGCAGPHRTWLAMDLDHLGVRALAPAPRMRPTPEEGWGVRYVLEGSALGGRVLLKRVAPLGLTEAAGARYFAGWGAATGAGWRAFGDKLETVADASSWPGIRRGAQRAFAELIRLASARLDEGLDPR